MKVPDRQLLVLKKTVQIYNIIVIFRQVNASNADYGKRCYVIRPILSLVHNQWSNDTAYVVTFIKIYKHIQREHSTQYNKLITQQVSWWNIFYVTTTENKEGTIFHTGHTSFSKCITSTMTFKCFSYHRTHLALLGFIPLPGEQEKAFANSCEFWSVPRARISFGECSSFRICFARNSFDLVSHHNWNEDTRFEWVQQGSIIDLKSQRLQFECVCNETSFLEKNNWENQTTMTSKVLWW